MVYPKIVVAAVILSKSKVLIARRSKWPEENKWALPGGKGSFKKFPNPKEAVKDEVKYDLNTEFIVDSFFNYDFNSGFEEPTIVLYFLGKVTGDIKINKQSHSEFKWVSEIELRDISKEEFAFDHYEFLTKNFDKFIQHQTNHQPKK